MIKTNKFSNLKRLNFKNKCIVLIYFIKIILKIKPTKNERELYTFFNYLINNNGYVFEETQSSYIFDFKNTFHKRIKLRKRPSSDIDVFHQIFKYHEYQTVVNSYKNSFSLNAGYNINIVDAGSNIGLTTLFFIEHFDKPNIISIEPEIENFKILEFNLINNNHSNIIKINGAVWSTNTRIKIIKDFRDKLDWSFRVEESEEIGNIPAFSINQLVKENNFDFIDILKIDIEGAEKQIFISELSNLDFLKITKCIAIEIHDEYNCREDIYNVLNNYGFTFFNHGELTIGINEKLKRDLI